MVINKLNPTFYNKLLYFILMKLGSIFTTLFTTELKSVLKLEKLENKSAKEVVDIWNTFHGSLPEAVSIAMNINKRNLFIERLTSNPLFMQPILRNPEFFFVYSHPGNSNKFITFYPMTQQIQDPLNADPCFILRIFDELENSHKIHLIRGDIIEKSLSKAEAERLMRGLLAYYIETELFEENVVLFNSQLSKFDHNKFLDEYIERFGRIENN